ncbi:cell wall metabolism sensor histidine kinase WalK [Pradoshia sp. D12]|uniref:cell wall metabolism sensor histidine kinase WalK n=1 Tax=Bacillaceae TaxID=186817 RepID=UPI00080AF412|nr:MULTISPECIES: cell wall metabolism sensor histidine kinase WalK [Bacillaceae]OCA81189.1 PAS domain-containing sensor histidine kinase [Bacillus sp. FJAT-27986]QFK73122.1 cell wall metabolism sensor histidine kinase WalK [Pradoshia sp. D12]TPF72115.1 cell wall metabolism sensor histidine kinase WalK [Bacillus sp. D12]
MRKVGFFKSIYFKFVLIYVLLILVAMQIIGVYFAQGLEQQLLENFKSSIQERVTILSYSLEKEITETRKVEDPTLIEDIKTTLEGYSSGDITEIRVMDQDSKIIGTSDPEKQDIIGSRSTEKLVDRANNQGTPQTEIRIDSQTGKRILLWSEPILSDGQIIGNLYLNTKIENVYSQLKQINTIMAKGTIISLAVTAFLGILLAQTITRPISDMRKQALAMSRGNFSRKVKVYGYDEIGQLAITFNSLTKKLQDAQATTDAEKRKLSSVLTNMTDGVLTTDRRGRVILINDTALSMLKVSRETSLSKPITEVLGLEDTFTFDQLLSEKDSIILNYSNEKKLLYLRANFSVIQRETGFINGLIVVLHDITEQEKIDEERREFVANVSHELRTPLTTMRSYLEALADGAMEDKELAPRFLNIAQTETERMIRLVNDLLQLSKLDNTDYKLSTTWVDFGRYFHRIIDRFEMSKSRNVTFKRLIPSEPIGVEIDEDKITQVLDNIISNALKYSPEGGQVTFKLQVIGQFVEISIRDEGMGIPKENVAKIFERFYRVDKARSRKMGGTGLGLAIAKEMIEAHKGHIWASSEEGKGTTIFFTLPYETLQEDDWE